MYNIFLTVATTLMITFPVMAQNTQPKVSNKVDTFVLLSGSGNQALYALTDPRTNCEYIVYFLGGSITMNERYGSDGNPICHNTDAEAESFVPLK